MFFGKKSDSKSDDSEVKRKIFMRPGVIDEEPDSLDSVLSNPSSLPLTVVPSLIRCSTYGSGISRQASYRYVFFFLF